MEIGSTDGFEMAPSEPYDVDAGEDGFSEPSQSDAGWRRGTDPIDDLDMSHEAILHPTSTQIEERPAPINYGAADSIASKTLRRSPLPSSGAHGMLKSPPDHAASEQLAAAKEYANKLSSKVNQQAEQLQKLAESLNDKENYIDLCEKRILDLCPSHNLPIRPEDIGSPPPTTVSTTTSPPPSHKKTPSHYLSEQTKLVREKRDAENAVRKIEKEYRHSQDRIAELSKTIKELRRALHDQDKDIGINISSRKHNRSSAVGDVSVSTVASARERQLDRQQEEAARTIKKLTENLRLEAEQNEEQRAYIAVLRKTLEQKVQDAFGGRMPSGRAQLVADVAEWKGRCEALQRDIKERSDQLNSAQTDLQAVTARASSLEQEVRQAQSQASALLNENQASTSTAQSLQDTLAVLENEKQALLSYVQDAVDDLARVSHERDESNGKVNALEEQKGKLEAQLKNVKGELEKTSSALSQSEQNAREFRADMEKAVNRAQDLEQQMEELQQELDESQAVQAELLSACKEAQRERDDSREKAETAESERNRVFADVDQWKAFNRSLQKEKEALLSEVHGERTAWSEREEQLTSKISALESDLDDLHSDLRTVREELDDKQRELEELELMKTEEVDTLSGQRRELQQQLESARGDVERLDGIVSERETELTTRAKEITQLNTELNELSTALTDEKNRGEALEAELDESKSCVETLETRMSEVLLECQQLSAELDEMKSDYEDLEKERRVERKVLHEEIHSLRDELKTLQRQVESESSKAKEAHAQIVTLSTDKQGEHDRLSRDLERMRGDLVSAREECIKRGEHLAQRERDVAEIRTQLSDTKKELDLRREEGVRIASERDVALRQLEEATDRFAKTEALLQQSERDTKDLASRLDAEQTTVEQLQEELSQLEAEQKVSQRTLLERIRVLESETELSGKGKSELETMCLTQKHQLTALHEKLEDREARVLLLESQVADAEAGLAKTAKELDDLRRTEEKFQSDSIAHSMMEKKLADEKSALQKRVDTMATKLKTVESERDAISSDLKELKQIRAELQAMLDAEKRERSTETKDSKTEVRHLCTLLEQIRAEKEEKDAELASTYLEKEKLAAQLARVQQDFEAAQESLRTEVDERERTYRLERKSHEDTLTQIEQHELEREQAEQLWKERLGLLEDRNAALEEELGETRLHIHTLKTQLDENERTMNQTTRERDLERRILYEKIDSLRPVGDAPMPASSPLPSVSHAATSGAPVSASPASQPKEATELTASSASRESMRRSDRHDDSEEHVPEEQDDSGDNGSESAVRIEDDLAESEHSDLEAIAKLDDSIVRHGYLQRLEVVKDELSKLTAAFAAQSPASEGGGRTGPRRRHLKSPHTASRRKTDTNGHAEADQFEFSQLKERVRALETLYSDVQQERRRLRIELDEEKSISQERLKALQTMNSDLAHQMGLIERQMDNLRDENTVLHATRSQLENQLDSSLHEKALIRSELEQYTQSQLESHSRQLEHSIHRLESLPASVPPQRLSEPGKPQDAVLGRSHVSPTKAETRGPALSPHDLSFAQRSAQLAPTAVSHRSPVQIVESLRRHSPRAMTESSQSAHDVVSNSRLSFEDRLARVRATFSNLRSRQ